ncbi:Extracellular ligand-binding receptor [Gloeothece citriformis PCC 7424]|uniref:Extracellular ligand-binding receptor n=1 Tax=Gloeothece citriformis (strain PCC 7424) TaxID=65393 RepID=B7KFJ5_GLOC7|nr:ABC transporter substrate-binding protein [Gloeothece citriformis]ACK73320.1 Extracellular ligand-binding receptor [Gloeothece citriformis PCC 7424]
MRQKQQSVQVLISLLIAGVAIALIIGILGRLVPRNNNTNADNTTPPIQKPVTPTNPRISLGNKILIGANTTPEKEAGVQAFANGDFETAVEKFEASRQIQRNDPETLIYLNNAKIGASDALKVAVVIPIGDNLDTAQEILRGVAQAQDEINSNGGINGLPLQIEIVNDDGKPNLAKSLASDLVKDPNIVAVIGHGSPGASLVAAPVYNSGELVMITPSFGPSKLSEMGDYIFRGSADLSVSSDALADYIVNKANIRTIAICVDSSIQFQDIRDPYEKAITKAGGKVTKTICDFADPLFDPNTIISTATGDGAKGLLLMPIVNKLGPAKELAKANEGRLGLFTHGGLYTYETLNQGRENFRGMILSAFWHPDADPGNPFFQDATELWGGKVNARTASAYDTTQAVIAGLEEGNTREGLKNALSDPNFSASGASGDFEFSDLRYRKEKPLFLKIDRGSSSGTGFDFVLIP